MMKTKHHGSCKTYPYYFISWDGKQTKYNTFTSGVFKTKKAAKTAAIDYSGKTKFSHPRKYRVIKRTCPRKR